MKPYTLGFCSVLLGLACLSASAAQPILVGPPGIQPGGAADDPNNASLTYSSGRPAWAQFWTGAASISASYDTTMQSSNNIPGSIHYILDCQGGAPANLAFGSYLPQGGGWLGDSSIVSAPIANYKVLGMDIYFNQTGASNITTIPLTIFDSSYGNAAVASIPTTNTGWQHLEITLDSTITLSSIAAIGFYEWYNANETTPGAHLEFWVDNIRLLTNSAPIPPPTMGIEQASQSGLLFDAGPGNTSSGGDIYTVNSASWLSANGSAASAVTYSLTIPQVPDPTVHSNIEAHILLTPGLVTGNWLWNVSDVGYLRILDNNDGTATASMLWKTNQPYDNKMYYDGSGTIGTLTASNMVGTWSMTFNDATSIILRGPGGAKTNLTLPQGWYDNFVSKSTDVTAVFGMSANEAQPLFLGKVSVSGPDNNWTNDFTSITLDKTLWGITGSQTILVTPRPAYWVNWTIPDLNFALEATSTVGKTNTWVQLTGNTNLTLPITTYRWGTNHNKTLILASDLPGTNQSYLRLDKRTVTKLQILLPGETSAPGTATGKTGTPTAQPFGSTIAVTVNAVDDNWNIVTYCTDALSLTCSDPQAITDKGESLPLTGNLLKGTATLNVIVYTTGTTTFTVKDTDTPAVTSATSAGLTVTE